MKNKLLLNDLLIIKLDFLRFCTTFASDQIWCDSDTDYLLFNFYYLLSNQIIQFSFECNSCIKQICYIFS